MKVETCLRSIDGCISLILKKICPCLWTLFRSPADKYLVVKGILGAPIGAIFGLVLYEIAFYDMEFATTIKIGCGLLFLVLTCIGFAASTQVRCMVFLIVPVFLGKEGRSMLSAAAVQYLVKGPVHNLVVNAEVFVESVNCNNNLSFALMKQRFELMAAPVRNLMKDFEKESGNLQKTSKRASSEFTVVENEVDDDEETDELRDSNSRIDKEGGTPSRNKLVDDMYKTPKGASAAKKAEVKYNKKQQLRCEELYSAGADACKAVFRKSEQKCKDKMPGIIEWLVCLPFKLTVLCKLVKLISKAFGLNCNAKEAQMPGFGELYYIASQSAKSMKRGFGVKMKMKIIAYKQKLDMTTPEDIKDDIMHAFKTKKAWLDYVLMLFKTLKSFMFLRVLLAAMGYLTKYLAKDEHDNVYMTDYFRKIDARRYMQGKKVLLPLKKAEKKEVIDVYNSKLNSAEKKKSISGIAKVASIIIVFVMIFIVDAIVVDVMDIITTHSQVTYEQEGEHEIKVTVRGEGALAKLLHSMVKNVNHTHEIDSTEDNFKCLPVPKRSEMTDKIQVFGILIVIMLMTMLDCYSLRLRRMVCAFFYPKREKDRILYLYNDMTKKRRSFLQHARRTIRRKAKEEELRLKGSVKFWRKFGTSKRKCLICGEKEDKYSKPCETEDCRALYCEECWIDINMKCYACRDKDDWSSHSSDDSDGIA